MPAGLVSQKLSVITSFHLCSARGLSPCSVWACQWHGVDGPALLSETPSLACRRCGFHRRNISLHYWDPFLIKGSAQKRTDAAKTPLLNACRQLRACSVLRDIRPKAGIASNLQHVLRIKLKASGNMLSRTARFRRTSFRYL